MTSDDGRQTRSIIDPHHHLWGIDFQGGVAGEFLLADLQAEAALVPGLTETMFMECGYRYRPDGPEHLRPVGETEFVAGLASESEQSDGVTIVGIVGHGDLTLPLGLLDETLDAHVAAGGGRFRGIRDALSCAPPGTPLIIAGAAEPGRAANPDFRRGVAHLGERGFTYDTWQYHFQLPEVTALAQAVPETTMVVDHFSTPLGIGEWAGRHDEIFEEWKPAMAALAACGNVVLKLGGLAMPDNGFWPLDGTVRPNVDEFLAVQQRWYDHALDCFGPERCMFESNYPVDKFFMDYATIWAAFERIAARFTPGEQAELFAGTARRVYKL